LVDINKLINKYNQSLSYLNDTLVVLVPKDRHHIRRDQNKCSVTLSSIFLSHATMIFFTFFCVRSLCGDINPLHPTQTCHCHWEVLSQTGVWVSVPTSHSRNTHSLKVVSSQWKHRRLY